MSSFHWRAAVQGYLQKQAELLDRQSDIQLCGCNVEYFPEDLVRDGARRYQKWINETATSAEIERDIFVECPIAHPTLMMRRDAFQKVGGYQATDWAEDYDLVLRFWNAGLGMAKVPEVLLRWREHDARLSRTDQIYSEDAFRRCKAHYLGQRIAGRSGQRARD